MFRYPWPQKTYLPCTSVTGRHWKKGFTNTTVRTQTDNAGDTERRVQSSTRSPRLRAKGDRGCEQSTKRGRPPVHTGDAQKAHRKTSPERWHGSPVCSPWTSEKVSTTCVSFGWISYKYFYRLNVCVLPKFLHWDPIPMELVLRGDAWSLWDWDKCP